MIREEYLCSRCHEETISSGLCLTCRHVQAREAGLIVYKPARAPYRDAGWQQTTRANAKLLAERGLPVLVEYTEFWSTPSGGHGVDIGYYELRNGRVVTDRTWRQRAPMGDLSTVFGQARGTLAYYLRY